MKLIPPVYERTPRIVRISSGELNFALHITKKSGGIIPSKDSESKENCKNKPILKTGGDEFENSVEIENILC